MARAERQQLIRQLEQARSSKVLVYFCSDRPFATAQIADDAIRPMYDHLLSFRNAGRNPQKLDLVLYSLGGVMETPWKIVTMLREFCQELHVIIPYKAYSGATLIAIGADKIWMTDKGELGPVDPALTLQPIEGRQLPFLLPDLGVEDIASYLSFLRNRAGLTDQTPLAACVGALAQSVTPPLLGRMERIYSHIRLVTRKLLALCRPPLSDPTVTQIVEALTEKTYVHGHGIGRAEARNMGLQIEFLDGPVKDLLWSLFLDYEADLRLRTTADPRGYFLTGNQDTYQENNAVSALVESEAIYHVFRGTLRISQVRRMPAQLTININLPVNLPPGIQPNQVPQAAQLAIQQLLAQSQQLMQQQVAQEIVRQCPVEKIDGGLVGGLWERI